MRTSRRIRGVPAFTAMLCAVALAGCGGSTGKGGGSAQSGGSAGIRFADCMRSHGVQSFPDPGSGGGIQLPNGINPQSPAFQSAQKACGNLLPGPGGGPSEASESQKLSMLAMSRCMRKHGVPSFPDPTATAPGPGSGFALAFGRPGSFIAIPESLINSPAFNRAAVTCGLPGTRGSGAKATPVG